MTRPPPDKASSGLDDGIEDLSPYLARLQTLVRPWAGLPVDRDGLIRILNHHGTKPPLLWCFNAQNEFTVMAALLGPDQPLLGMRSLNAAASPGPGRQALGFRLAEHYARLLAEVPGLERCAVGGNCQAASIATRLALALREAGRRVDLLLTLEAAPPMPYPGRVALFFGAESERHNPFLQSPCPHPQNLWKVIYREVSWTIVPGRHGQFFGEANASALCAAIARNLADAFAAQPPQLIPQGRLLLASRPTWARAGGVLRLSAEVRDSALDGPPYVVYAQWQSAAHGLWVSPSQSLPSVGTDGPTDLDVVTPNEPLRWRLVPFLCRSGMGPVSWHEDFNGGLDIDLRRGSPGRYGTAVDPA